MVSQKQMITAGAIAASVLGREVWLRSREENLSGQVAMITGGSRGLGLAMARVLADEGCKLVICSRNEAELDEARRDLLDRGADVLAIRCDVANQAQVEQQVAIATARFGPIDLLINNAGVVQVGPLESCRLDDFQQAMDIMFWGTLYPTLAVLPSMRERKRGRIVNITSIGGRFGMAHMLPYDAAKFAATGLSEGLHAELAKDGISVTTITPGLMRTGSHLNAIFNGRRSSGPADHSGREEERNRSRDHLPGVVRVAHPWGRAGSNRRNYWHRESAFTETKRRAGDDGHGGRANISASVA
jgi:NAD(P)-dependent dehydrogenase (short-subunit alcohol dehydrogenase family)